MPHSSSRNSAPQFENKLCYCHWETGCNFIGLFSTCLQWLMFISLNVRLSSDCRELSRDAVRQCHTDTGKAGSNSPYSNCWHYKPTAARSGQPQHTAAAVTVTWEAAHLCLWKDNADSHDRGGGAHAAILLMFRIPNDIGGQGEYRNTHKSPRTSYCKLSQPSLRAPFW